MSSRRAIPQEPNAPQIFFGREVELTQIVHMVFSGIDSRPARIAILGPGGYGKTTLANAVLTHDRIREHFGDARHFVPCESTFSSEALLIELGKTLGVLDGPPHALWFRIRTALSSRESILCLDNFESPWDQSSELKHSVEELLSRITVLHQVTILITMRGAERPARTHWSRPFLDPLNTFGQTAAEQVWQAIAGNYNEYAGKLTTAVDYVPLAVDVLAHLSQMTPPMLLWEEWNSKRTRVIQIGQMHRLSNLEYSIQLSIDCQRMKSNPSAKSLLGVLSMLPDGLHINQLVQFQGMLVDVDITSCLRTLQQCSLINLTEERYQLHPIVRHVCKNQGLILIAHKAIMEDFYINLASDSHNSSPEAYQEIVLEVNNTKAVLLDLLQSNYNDQPKLIEATVNFTWFQIRIGNHSDNLISQAVHFVQKNHGAIALHIECLSIWGLIYAEARNLEAAQEKLKEAERLCQSSFDLKSPLYGEVLIQLGDTYILQDAINEGMACIQSALKIFKRKHLIFGQGSALNGIGDIYSRLGQWDKAITSQQNAIQLLKHNNSDQSHRIQGNAHLSLGETYIRQNRLMEAEDEIHKAIEFYKPLNEILGQGSSYLSFGILHLKLKQPNKAIAACQKALEFHIAVNDPWNQGRDHCELGNIYLFQGKLDEAENSYMTALELHKVVKSLWGQGNDFYGLGRLYMEKQELEKASGMFEKARESHSKSQDRLAVQRDEEYLCKLVTEGVGYI
jgi:tetratricopeptide (TPR) repeat protein